jgi:predicted nicotinamide N-methyase
VSTIPFAKGSRIGKCSKKCHSIHPQDENDEAIIPDKNDTDKDDEESCNSTSDSNTGFSVSQSNLEETKQTIKSLNSTISSLGQAKPPLLQHRQNCSSKSKQAVKNNNITSVATRNSHAATSQQPCQEETRECAKTVKKQSISKVQTSVNTSERIVAHKIAAVVRNDYGSITEYILPSAICQTRVFGVATASNACTIISTLCARAFLSSTLSPPFSADELTSTVNRYEQIIQTGNMLYGQLHLSPGQPNLEVREVISKIKHLDMVLTEDVGYFHVEEFVAKINNLLESNTKQAGVLIVPAARSYAVLVQKGKIALFDSHAHGDNGGLICVSESGCGREFVSYLAQRESLCGSNFALLSLK